MRGELRLARIIIEGKLENTLPLWLDAIGQGDYSGAKRILETRTALRAQLARLIADEESTCQSASLTEPPTP